MISKIFGEIIHFVIRIAVIIVALTALLSIGKWAYSESYDVMSKTSSEDQKIKNVSVEIPKGTTTEGIANILKEGELIDSAMYFRVLARLKGYDGKFQYGDYTLSTGMGEEDMMTILLTEGAKRPTKSFTIVEGLSLSEVAQSLAEQDVCKVVDFYDALDNTKWGYKFLESVPSKEERAISYQGYLFPSTYEIYEDATPVDVISTMFDQTDKIWTQEYYDRAEELDLTVDEVMTIASIIEEEVVEPTEQPIVSEIIYNRLEQKIPLQMCSTVMYVLGKHRNRLLYEDLKVESPYNTYIVDGLPVGPISNPGAGAIRAALYPDSNDYLYFVLKDDGSGTHEFNSDYNQHVNDKAKYVNTFNY